MVEEWVGLGVAAAGLCLLVGLLGWVRSARSPGERRLPQPPARPAGSDDAAEWGAAWQRGRTAVRASASAEALLRAVRDELQRAHNEAAVVHWLALGTAGLESHAEPALSIRMAALLRHGGRNEEAVAALRAALRRSGGPTGLAVAVRVARAAADLDPALAADAAWRALASPEIDLPDRQDLERLLERLQLGEGIEPGEDVREPAAPQAAAPEEAERPGTAAPEEAERHGTAAPEEAERHGTAAPEEAERPRTAAPAGPITRPEPIDLGHLARRLEVTPGTLVELEPAGLRIALESGGERVVGWREFDAIAVGAVDGFGAKPVLVIDLVAGWCRPADEPLRIVRLRGDRYDPRKIAPGPSSPVDAFRQLVDRLLGESGATPLPDLRAARGRPFAGFRNLTAFEEDVLASEEGGSAGQGS